MTRSDAFDFYIDYLISSPGQVSATGLSRLLDNRLKHDYISDALNEISLDQKFFWQQVKPFVRQIERDNSVLSIDDTLIEKPHSSENEIVTYHFDHTKGKSIKGINLLNFLLSSELDGQTLSCPLSFRIIRKDEPYQDKAGKTKYKSKQTKNEMVLEQLHRLVKLNQVKFKYVLFDIWFGSAENLRFIHHKIDKHFVCPLKGNRLLALSLEDKKQGKFTHVSQLKWENQEPRQVYVKGLDFAVQLVKQVFINKDRSKAELYLITNDTDLDYTQITTIYQKRWKVEQFHKSLKQNAALAKSPTKMERTQSNHIMAALLAFVRLERLKVKERLNHFAFKARLYLKMLRVAFDELQELKISANI